MIVITSHSMLTCRRLETIVVGGNLSVVKVVYHVVAK